MVQMLPYEPGLGTLSSVIEWLCVEREDSVD
jgi:hypothetical protein